MERTLPFALYTLRLTPAQFYEMTPAEFKAARAGYESDEEARLKELAWHTFWTLRPLKRPPSRAKLYKELTGKAWIKGTDTAKKDTQDRQAGTNAAIGLLRGLTKAGAKAARTPQDRARELGKHVSDRRKARRNGS